MIIPFYTLFIIYLAIFSVITFFLMRKQLLECNDVYTFIMATLVICIILGPFIVPLLVLDDSRNEE
jgi:hypothetical protein